MPKVAPLQTKGPKPNLPNGNTITAIKTPIPKTFLISHKTPFLCVYLSPNHIKRYHLAGVVRANLTKRPGPGLIRAAAAKQLLPIQHPIYSVVRLAGEEETLGSGVIPVSK